MWITPVVISIHSRPRIVQLPDPALLRRPDISDGGTGIVLLNMGGPETLDDVEPFLLSLFEDKELIQLPFQDVLGRFIAKRRTPSVRELYAAIGGGSPILHWTREQGKAMVERLDAISPETAPHRFYVAFRYVNPSADDALRQMQADGVKRAIAFSQYPQYSCATTGSSLNDLWRALDRLQLRDAFKWSVIDRWHTHSGFVEAMADSVRKGLAAYPDRVRERVLVMFSAHSLPLSIVDRGDAYPQEVGATVDRVMEALNINNPYMLSYQSEVGPVRWLGPSTEKTIRALAQDGRKNLLVVPIAFTSDHIETLSELDIEYGHLAKKLGMTGYTRAPALNTNPIFLDAMADIVDRHIKSGERHSTKYKERCPGCRNPRCRTIPSPIVSGLRIRAVA